MGRRPPQAEGRPSPSLGRTPPFIHKQGTIIPVGWRDETENCDFGFLYTVFSVSVFCINLFLHNSCYLVSVSVIFANPYTTS